MARTLGAKNKPKNGNDQMRCETLKDVLTPQETATWLRTSRSEIMRRIYSGEIPNTCFFRVGSHYKLIKTKIAVLFGIKENSVA